MEAFNSCPRVHLGNGRDMNEDTGMGEVLSYPAATGKPG